MSILAHPISKKSARLSTSRLRSIYRKKYGARLLAIDPGTRQMGVAVFDRDGSLVHYQVLNLKAHRPRPVLLRATVHALDRLVDFFMVDRVVMEKISNPQPPTFQLLVAQVQAVRRWARRRSLSLVELAAQTVRKHIVHNGRATKREAAQIVISHYPALRIFFTQDFKYKLAYWQNLYDAVALGMAHRDLEGARRRARVKS